jgi:hypothetical protein
VRKILLILLIIPRLGLAETFDLNDSIRSKLIIKNILIYQLPVESFEDSLFQDYRGYKTLFLDYKKHNDITFVWEVEKKGKVITDTTNEFAYRLLGYDKEWIFSAGIKNYTRYTHLHPGYYCFEIKYSENGKWVEENNIKQYLIIKPKFWQTWWFKAGLIGLKLTIIILVI